MPAPDLDFVAIGRSCVDLYSEQTGCGLENVRSFAKYVGGCPANICVGAARLGLKPALLSRVGDEQFGRFVRGTLAREGVDVSGVAVDPKRLTALAILAIEDEDRFPLLFVRADCADAALTEDDVDPGLIRRARAVVLTGTHLSTPALAAASLKAARVAREAGRRVVLDIDYRPVLWGLAGLGEGDNRFVADAAVTERLHAALAVADLVVGTEEEMRIAGGAEDPVAALRAVRAVTGATLVLKTGPKGCRIFEGAIPDAVEEGLGAPAPAVEVFNVLGAGDGFMAGFLSGWLRDLPLADCARRANACGALAVSRHGCAPSYPSAAELDAFLARPPKTRRLREDRALERMHRATTARAKEAEVLAFAIDHRDQFEAMAREAGAPPERIAAFKRLAVEAAGSVDAPEGARIGMLLDDRHGRGAIAEARRRGFWLARPAERPGSRPLEFEIGDSLGVTLRAWPPGDVVKCLCRYGAEDADDLRAAQAASLRRLQAAAEGSGLDLLIEVIGPGPNPEQGLAAALRDLYDRGLTPDWWKLPAMPAAEWAAVSDVVAEADPFCRGVLVLGLDAPAPQLREAVALAAAQPLCRGFAIGRTLFGATARAWFAGTVADGDARETMAGNFAEFVTLWREARAG